VETYKLLVESWEGGRGRTLTLEQITDILMLIQAMDRKIGELMGFETVEVIDGEVEIPFDEGPSGEEPGVDSPQQEEE